MSRKWILSLYMIGLAAVLLGCAFTTKKTPAERTSTQPVAQLVATNVPPPLPTMVPTAAPQATSTPAPLPTTEPPPATEPPPTSAPAVPAGPAMPRLESGKPVTITWIDMQDAASGWAIGRQGHGSDHVLITADGGQTWRDVTPPEPANADEGLAALGYFADTQSAWVIYHSQDEMLIPATAVVWRTQDGGQTWWASASLDLQGLNEFYSPSDLVFVDAENGWLLVHVGAGMSHDYVVLFRTQDGGQTWARLIDPYGDSGIQACQKTGLVFPSAQNGWLTGDCGGVMAGAFLYQTADGGQTWQPVILPSPADAPDLFSDSGVLCSTQSAFFTSSMDGKLIVRCLDTSQDPYVTRFILYTTRDGGVVWVPTHSPAGTLAFVSGDTGWALSRDLFSTTDGGQTWLKVKTVNLDGQFSFVSQELGWAVARNETDAGTLMAFLQTTNGGKTWTEIKAAIAP
jgi:photosystem II stability/assembly factor-like uncharacterized protein